MDHARLHSHLLCAGKQQEHSNIENFKHTKFRFPIKPGRLPLRLHLHDGGPGPREILRAHQVGGIWFAGCGKIMSRREKMGKTWHTIPFSLLRHDTTHSSPASPNLLFVARDASKPLAPYLRTVLNKLVSAVLFSGFLLSARALS